MACSAALLAIWAEEAGAAYPGQNGGIAFYKFDGVHDDEIYSVRADGSGLRQVTDSPRQDSVPAWSPDGTKIAFLRGGDVWVMNASDGTGQANLIPNSAGSYGIDPSWSPDGARVAFPSYYGSSSNGDIFAVGADGSGRTNLPDTPLMSEAQPAWSPNGGRIAFVVNGEGGNDVWTMRADGTGRLISTDTPG